MSIRFQADADLNFEIVEAVRKQEPAIDFASALDSRLEGVADPEVIVSQDAAIGPVVESIVLLWSISDVAELRDQIYHLPSLRRHVFTR